MVITTAQLHSIKPELRFCASLNLAHDVSEIRDGEDLWQCSRLEIKLNTFRRSTIPQKQFKNHLCNSQQQTDLKSNASKCCYQCSNFTSLRWWCGLLYHCNMFVSLFSASSFPSFKEQIFQSTALRQGSFSEET